MNLVPTEYILAELRRERAERQKGQDALTGSVAAIPAISAAVKSTQSKVRQVERQTNVLVAGQSDISAHVDAVEYNAVTAAAALDARATSLESGLAQTQSDLAAARLDLSSAEGRIVSLESFTRTQDEALTVYKREVGVKVGQLSASVTEEASARISADGQIHARWGVAIDINGRVVGRINLDGTNQSSEFKVAVDKFVVENANGTITALDIRTGGKIVMGADVQSDNFVAGVSGWRLERNSGDVEFGSGTFRGTVKGGATSFSSGTGFWMGLDGGVYKFRVGDPAGARIEWNGTSWNVVSFAGATPSFTLTLTNSTGNPLYNPTASPAGPYSPGDIVTITAVDPAGGSPFLNWSGSTIDMNCVENPAAASTVVVMTHNISLSADY